MKQYLPVIMKTKLFSGFSAEETNAMLNNLSPSVQSAKKDDVLILAGEKNTNIGIVLQGRAEAVKHSRDGGQFTVASVAPGGVFGDIMSTGHSRSPVTVFAAENSTVMRINSSSLFAKPEKNEELYRRLLANLVSVMSDKYFALDKRMDLLLMHGIKKRVAAFLLDTSQGAEKQWFKIPFSRAQLASYLGCERSALSREISNMANAGLIETKGREFYLPNVRRLKQMF